MNVLKPIFWLCFIYSCIISSNVRASAFLEIPEEARTYLEKYKHELYEYELDDYGNLRVEVKENSPDLIPNLEKIKTVLSEKWDKRGMFVYLPILAGSLSEEIIKAGFELYDLDRVNNKLIYLYKNGRAIPNISNSFNCTAVFIVRNNPQTNERELLVINEYDKAQLTIPSGCFDDEELAVDAAIREAHEEVGISLDRGQLRVVGISNSISKKAHKNIVIFYFVARVPSDTDVKIDSKEVVNYQWVPISKVLEGSLELFGKKLLPIYAELLKDRSSAGTVKFLTDQQNLITSGSFELDTEN